MQIFDLDHPTTTFFISIYSNLFLGCASDQTVIDSNDALPFFHNQKPKIISRVKPAALSQANQKSNMEECVGNGQNPTKNAIHCIMDLKDSLKNKFQK